MSALLMGRAFYVPLDMASRIVLLSLADHANDDGTEARPGLYRLQIKTGLSRRAVQDCLAHLEYHDLIKASGYRRGGHGRATNWTVNAHVCRAFADWFEDFPGTYQQALQNSVADAPLNSAGDAPFEKNSAACGRKQCSVAQLTVQRAAPQPSGTINKPDDSSNPEAERQPGESNRVYRKRLLDGIGKTI